MATHYRLPVYSRMWTTDITQLSLKWSPDPDLNRNGYVSSWRILSPLWLPISPSGDLKMVGILGLEPRCLWGRGVLSALCLPFHHIPNFVHRYQHD